MKPQNENEQSLLDYLEENKSEYTALELWPASGRSISPDPVNICKINEGRKGTFAEISEGFYDSLVDTYDWRCNRHLRFPEQSEER